jgi:protein-S-isoprenylcysteine O-methyltransferase Ste14
MTETIAPSRDGLVHLPIVVAGRPRSAVSGWVGPAGLAVSLIVIPALQSWLAPNWLKAVAVMLAVAGAMIAADALTHRLGGRRYGLKNQALRDLNPVRVGQKLAGFWLMIGALAAAYGLLPVYAAASFTPFKDAALACLPALVVIAPFYIAYVDRRQDDPNDAYVQLSALLAGLRPADWTVLRQHVLGWLVKGFFLPLMFGFIVGDLSDMWSEPLIPDLHSFEAIFSRLLALFYFFDVLLAGIAYALTLRLLDTHVRSAEPTFFGWAVCLLCYAPFNAVTGQFFPYDQDNLYWGKVFAPYPAAYAIWGTVILALIFVYMWSTAAFGLRFSNLTNRGIITNGPYRWTKHPAYVSKNLSWWLISMPFIAGAGWQQAVQSCLLLGGVNLIYFLRARTEERHLGRDPAYRAYAQFIARHGLLARLSGTKARAA